MSGKCECIIDELLKSSFNCKLSKEKLEIIQKRQPVPKFQIMDIIQYENHLFIFLLNDINFVFQEQWNILEHRVTKVHRYESFLVLLRSFNTSRQRQGGVIHLIGQ